MGTDAETRLFGFSVSSWPKWLILLVGSGGIFVTFLIEGICHEHLIKKYHFQGTFFLPFFQFLGYASLSAKALILILSGRLPLTAPLYWYVIPAISLSLSMSLTQYSTVRLSYATGILFKSSKLIPLMIGNALLLKRKPKPSEVFSAVLIVLGLVCMSLGDVKSHNKIQLSGIVAITASLLAGATASNCQEIVFGFGASQEEVIALTYSIGGVIVLSGAIATGEMAKGLQIVAEHPESVVHIALFGVLGAIGIQFIYLTMKEFGSFMTTVVTSIRKGLTIAASFLIFRDKVFTVYHAISIAAIVAGTAVSVRQKTKTKED
jgi:adenosine 3'-phospho 5'-phosphosulfate transporter B3